jgi:antitoxin PrlF
MPTATITSKGQITFPKEVRDHLKLAEGDRVEFIIDAGGEVRVRTVSGSVRKLHGLLRALERP